MTITLRARVVILLERFDRDRRDGRRCQLRSAFERKAGCLVYIRRPHTEGRLLIGDRLRHGHRGDWIVLEFRKEGRLLNVASHGKKASFAIADQIASSFYGQPCEYVNIEEVVYSAQLKAFLDELANDKLGFRLNSDRVAIVLEALKRR